MVGTEGDVYNLLSVRQQSCQLQDTLTGHNHLMALLLANIGLYGAHGEPVAIGGDGAQVMVTHLQQHAVKIVTDILLRHGKTGTIDQAAQTGLDNREAERGGLLLDTWKLVRRQG